MSGKTGFRIVAEQMAAACGDADAIERILRGHWERMLSEYPRDLAELTAARAVIECVRELKRRWPKTVAGTVYSEPLKNLMDALAAYDAIREGKG